MAALFRWCALVVILCPGVVAAADPPRSTPESVRATIIQLWSNKPDEVEAAFRKLADDPLALPVLRRAAATDPDVGRRAVLEKVVANGMARQDKVSAGRVTAWADDGRLDLLTEVRALTDRKAADAALTHLIERGQGLIPVGQKLLGERLPGQAEDLLRSLPCADRAAFDKSNAKPQFDAEHALGESKHREFLALFADRIAVPTENLFHSVLVARSELTTLSAKGRPRMVRSLVLANAALQVREVTSSVVVVDGDLELVKGSDLTGCVVVVNGDIVYGAGASVGLFWKCLLWATGDIGMKPGRRPHQSVFLANGKIPHWDGLADEGCVNMNVKEPPLPVRFLDPAADYGLTLDAGKDGMTVAKIAEKSAFAEYLKAGDVIAAVTGVKTATAPAFRRELRRGIIEGAVLLDVTRGKEKLELLVPVPDVPAALKKAKEKDLKATPPEKK